MRSDRRPDWTDTAGAAEEVADSVGARESGALRLRVEPAAAWIPSSRALEGRPGARDESFRDAKSDAAAAAAVGVLETWSDAEDSTRAVAACASTV